MNTKLQDWKPLFRSRPGWNLVGLTVLVGQDDVRACLIDGQHFQGSSLAKQPGWLSRAACGICGRLRALCAPLTALPWTSQEGSEAAALQQSLKPARCRTVLVLMK